MLLKNPWATIFTYCLVIPALLLVLAADRLWAGNEYLLSVSLAGEREITVEYGTQYEEPGVKASFWGSFLQKEPVQVQVDITSNVDANKLGSYTVSYRANHKEYVGTAYRRVHVVDTQAPVITLHTDPDYFTLPGDTYQEEGFSATDNHDGDLTDRVVRQQSEDAVTYSVTDSSGNTTEIIRKILYYDPVPPELTLVDGDITVYAGDIYQEPGFKAVDNCDGDITSLVSVEGSAVDTFLPGGEYVFTYSVKDAYGNCATATRKVNVISHPEPEIVEPEGKVIYLTFDDGPGAYTEDLLAILKKYNVKATFFVVGTNRTDLLTKIDQEGHAIGIHSKTHAFHDIYASEEAFFQDLLGMQEIIREHTGKTVTLMRFPGGGSNTISRFNPGIMTKLTKLVKAHGFRYFDWNVDSDDAGRAKTSYEVYSNVISGVKNYDHSIVLQHDIKEFSVDAVERIIRWGIANGYQFLPLTQDSPICEHTVYN